MRRSIRWKANATNYLIKIIYVPEVDYFDVWWLKCNCSVYVVMWHNLKYIIVDWYVVSYCWAVIALLLHGDQCWCGIMIKMNIIVRCIVVVVIDCYIIMLLLLAKWYDDVVRLLWHVVLWPAVAWYIEYMKVIVCCCWYALHDCMSCEISRVPMWGVSVLSEFYL